MRRGVPKTEDRQTIPARHSAAALATTIGDPATFKSGRELVALHVGNCGSFWFSYIFESEDRLRKPIT
jgi:hypothetical protein